MQPKEAQCDEDDVQGSVTAAVVHVRQSHNLTVDLQSFTDDAKLVILPYTNMAPGHQVYLYWESAGQGGSWEDTCMIDEQNTDLPLIFDLPREYLQASVGHANELYYIVDFNGRELESKWQVFNVVQSQPEPNDYLAPPYIENVPPGEIHPEPGSVKIHFQRYADMSPGDEVILYADGVNGSELIWKQIEDDDTGEDSFFLRLDESFLNDHQGTTITLLYAFAREGKALSARPLSLKVSAKQVSEPVAHLREALDLNLYLKDFRNSAHLTVLPYTDMAAQDQLNVLLVFPGDPPKDPVTLDYKVPAEQVGDPITFELERQYLVAGQDIDVSYTVVPASGTDKSLQSDSQRFSIIDARSPSELRLPDPFIEGAVDNILYPTPEGTSVTIALGESNAVGDHVLFYTDGRLPSVTQWSRVGPDEYSAGNLQFTLGAKLLNENVDEFISLQYQWGRMGAARSGRLLTFDIVQFEDAVVKSRIHVKQSHDLSIDPSTFKGDALVTLLPYRFMAEDDVITLLWEVLDSPIEPYEQSHRVDTNEPGQTITFRLPHTLVEAADEHQVRISYSVRATGSTDLLQSLSQTLNVGDASTKPRLPAPIVERANDGELPPDAGTTTVLINAYPDMKIGDELIFYAESAWPLRSPSLRISEKDMDEGQLAFELPEAWLTSNAGWPLTLFYQVARTNHALTSEALRLDIGERHDSPATGTVLHCPHAHDRIVDLATFEGDSMLTLLPYQNMAVGQTVEVLWQLAGEPTSEKLDERVTTPEDVGQTMSFVLSRQRLEAMTDRLVQLYYKVWFGDRQIESSWQDILVVYDKPPSEPALEALPINVVHPDTGNFVLTFELYEGAQLEDELVLYATGAEPPRPQWLRVRQEHLNESTVTFYLAESFLRANLNRHITLQYQFARPGQCLGSQPQTLPVSMRSARMPNTCAHFKEAHDLTVDLTSFSGDAHLTVLPYPDMAEGDTVAVRWEEVQDPPPGAPPIEHTVTIDEVGQPLSFELARSTLVSNAIFHMSFTVKAPNRPLRESDIQRVQVVDAPSGGIEKRLPSAQVEGAMGNELIGPIHSAKVIIPAYPGMKLNDEVLFYIDADYPVPTQWLRIENEDVCRLYFELDAELLRGHWNSFIDLSYQYGRQDQALSAEPLRLHIIPAADAIETALVHCQHSHDLVIDLKSLEQDASLAVLPYQHMQAADKLTVFWTPYRNGVPETTFPLYHTVTPSEVGKVIAFTLHRDQVQRAKGSTARLRYSVQAKDSLLSSAEQEFKVVEGSPSPKPKLPAPFVQGGEDGTLPPDVNGAKVIVNAPSAMAMGDECIFYLNGLKPFTPAGQRVGERELTTHLLEFRLPGTWLIQNAEQTVTLLYQFARHQQALSSEHLQLHIEKLQVPIKPGPVVHFQQAINSQVAIATFTSSGLLYVLPNEHIAAGDTVTLHWQKMDGQTPVGAPGKIVESSIGQPNEPVEFTMDRDLLSDAVGYRLQFHFSVIASGTGDPKFTSDPQTFTITDNDPPTAPPLTAATVEGVVNGSLFPGAEGAKVVIDAYEGMLAEDEVMLFAEGIGANGARPERHWQRVEPEQTLLEFKLTPSFLNNSKGKPFALHYACARPGLALSGRKIVLQVLESLSLAAPTNVKGSELAAQWLREGTTFKIEANPVLDTGTVELSVMDNDALLFSVSAYRQDSNKNLLLDVPAALAMLMIGANDNTLTVQYQFTNSSGQTTQSATLRLTVKTLDKDSLPWLQCTQAQGRTTLPLSRAQGSSEYVLPGWPLMAVGQRVLIVATAYDTNGQIKTFTICNNSVTQAQVNSKAFTCRIANSSFLDKLRLGSSIRFETSIFLSVSNAEIKLNIVDITLSAN